MPAPIASRPYICVNCLHTRRLAASTACHSSIRIRPNIPKRQYVQNTARWQPEHGRRHGNEKNGELLQPGGKKGEHEEEPEGAMSRRLRDMSEETLESGGRGARKAVLEAGFSDDLKAQLEQRIASASFRSSEAGLPSSVSRHSRDIATASPWTGTESLYDANLRMLNDAHKPLRVNRGSRGLGPSVQPPKSLDTGRNSNAATGTRLANARDRSDLYSALKEDPGLDKAEREKRFQELKDRFSPHARSIVPGTIQGLSSLANERIEDAIARGQFENIPRGKGKNVERDYNASNPFLDTTEYFMNKIIQKQEIMPPWIEKQQELVTTASKFRSRLRADWKRHAAMVIASKGGTLEAQIQRAEAYAKAELISNPVKKKEEVLNTVGDDGHISQISLSGELKIPSASDQSVSSTPVTEEIFAERKMVSSATETTSSNPGSQSPESPSKTQSLEIPLPAPAPTTPPAPYPFRDPNWESIESAYHTVAINDLNGKTRSYNLQAPELAKKPYFSLQRELNACYADVAPQLAEAIRERARKPIGKVEGFGQALSGEQQKGVFGNLGGEKVRVRDERVEKQYGFKQFWKELWRLSNEKTV